MDLLSLVRLATDFNMLPERFRSLTDMFIEIQPSVQFSAGKPVEPSDRDRRANYSERIWSYPSTES